MFRSAQGNGLKGSRAAFLGALAFFVALGGLSAIRSSGTAEGDAGQATPAHNAYAAVVFNDATPSPPPTLTPLPDDSELLVFDWNEPALKKHHGFPWDDPPRALANGNWQTPVNFAEGTLYFRAEVRHMPTDKMMFLQFCFWQYRNTLENCSRLQALTYAGDLTVVTWEQEVVKLWKKGGRSIDWVHPRDRNGVSIKNSDRKPVSDYSDWNWNGEDPDDWYPMDLRFTVVVVEKGQTFSGWANYIP
jgi:hypothetical protein